MFEGKHYRIRQKGRNSYEFRSPYTCVTKTGPEVTAIVRDELMQARRNQMELLQAKDLLASAIDREHGVAPVLAAPPPLRTESAHAPVVSAVPEEKVPATVLEVKPAVSRPRASAPYLKAKSQKSTRAPKNKVYAEAPANDNNAQSEKPTKRVGGLAYLKLLRQQVSLEQATG